MANTRTLTELITEIRQRADMVNSTFVTDPEITRYVNESISDLYDMLIAAQGQEWYIKQYTFPTVSGQDTYQIPADQDFYLLLGVDADTGGITPVPLRPYMLDERNDRGLFYPNSGWGYLERVRYRMSGNIESDPAAVDPVGTYYHQITLKPAPGGAHNITLLFIPHAPSLVAVTDVWDGFNGWEEYAIVDAAIKCLEKEESSTIALDRRKERLIERINAMGSAHDDGFPERVVDVMGRLNYYYIR
jgi:uncharacterized protein YfkK (UPF0435 family)